MKKYEYEKLKQKTEHGNWYFFLGHRRIGKQYEYLGLVEVLNILGEEGWLMVSSLNSENHIMVRGYED